jgi:hypothetical protein
MILAYHLHRRYALTLAAAVAEVPKPQTIN